MVFRSAIGVAILTILVAGTLAGNVALVRDPTVVSAETSEGMRPVILQPVAASSEVNTLFLSDTLSAADLQIARRELTKAFSSSFLKSHPVRIIAIAQGKVQMNEPASSVAALADVLKRLAPGMDSPPATLTQLFTELADNTSALPDNWSPAILVGRFPAESPDERQSEAWLSAWIGDSFRNRHVRVSFWSVDENVPAWARDLSQSSLGLATDQLSSMLPLLTSTDVLYQTTWTTKLKTGSWPALVALVNKAGDRVASLNSLCGDSASMPIGDYVQARAARTKASPDNEDAARKVLQMNALDADALTALGSLYMRQHKAKESATEWRLLSQVSANGAGVWAGLALADYESANFEEAEAAINKAEKLGLKNRPLFETQARLCLRRNDYATAAQLVDQAMALPAGNSGDQPLLLLRADCAHGMKTWSTEAESIEGAMRLGPVPLERSGTLIDGYLTAGQNDRALANLRIVTKDLPKDAATQCQYASFWERAHDDASAENLWNNAIAADQRFEPAYLGLSANLLRSKRAPEALEVVDRGLKALPPSAALLLMKGQLLEAAGDYNAARKLLAEKLPDANKPPMLERKARLEDWYGSGGADAYMAFLHALANDHAPANLIAETCRRGLAVAIRDEKPEQAKAFAAMLNQAGDSSGLALLKRRETAASANTQLLGGAEAFYFLLFGQGSGHADRIFMDASRYLLSAAAASATEPGKSQWQLTGQHIHEYFHRISALSNLGERKPGSVEIELSLSTKAGKERTQKVFDILGLKLKRGREGVTIQSSVGKEQTKKQDTLSALAIDDQAIQEALSSGGKYVLTLPMDTVPLFPSEQVWQQAFYDRQRFPGGLPEAMVADPKIPGLYLALNSMDRGAAEALLKSMPLRSLAERYSAPLAAFSSALAIRTGHAEVPGGRSAEATWLTLTGAAPDKPAQFFQALLSKDDGRLIAFFYTLSQLDASHQKFFTRSAERTSRFYSLFRESREMRRGGDIKLGNSAFLEFLRNIPLNEDGGVDFPGSPQVWMVAKGSNTSGSSVSKMARKIKKSAAPDDEDEILIRLANSDYKVQNGQLSELANFIAVAQIDAQRDEPLGEDAALLLAQAYGGHRGLFPYFAELGDLEAADYQSAFSFQTKLAGMDASLANLRAGEFHSALAMLGLLRESGLVPSAKVVLAYRTCVQRYLQANEGAAWTAASLSTVDDLSQMAASGSTSRDQAIRLLLIGKTASGRREKSFDQVLGLQKVPSLDGLCSILSALKKVGDDPHALDEIDRQLLALAVLPTPKEWKETGEQKKYLSLFENAAARNIVAKLRERLAKKKRTPADVEKLCTQLLAELEPWTQLAMTGRIYARFLDPSDLLVSEDAMLLRKHQFISLERKTASSEYFSESSLSTSSQLSGSHFEGGLAAFSLSAGAARAAGNHIGESAGIEFSKALIGSVRATDWRSLTPAALLSFNATVRLAREWIVESATSVPMREVLETQTRGILSLNRRNNLLEALDARDWPSVWRSASLSDLHFIGDALLEQAPLGLWTSAPLRAMKAAAAHKREPDELGQVAPDLNGCGQPRLRRYEPYEEYLRHLQPFRLAERLAELKLYLAWKADGAWPPETLAEVAPLAADQLLRKMQIHDAWDWEPIIEGLRMLKPEEIELPQ